MTPHPVRERVDVECRRKPPLPAIDIQEAIVAQLIVHIGDEDEEAMRHQSSSV
jgi:hypothetical protein